MKPLYDRIRSINKNLKARFCMPGHGGKGVDDDLYSSAHFDWTEAEGLDNLLQSDGVILQCEKKIAKSMGTERALMLTQGSTCGMQIALAAAKERGDTVIAVGDMHKSFWATCDLLNLRVLYFDKTEEVDVCDFKNMRIGGVFITSPDYYGTLKDVGALRSAADALGAFLAVDGAHSAHFCYSSLLPNNACNIADIVLISMHKTLPVYGGGALLCVNGDETFEVCSRLRSMIHSSSPNYLTMASMDYADEFMSEQGERLYASVKQKIDLFKKTNTVGSVAENEDFTRLVIKIEGKDAYGALVALAERGVYAEAAYGDMLVFIVTPFNCDKLDMLARELKNLKLDDLDCDFADLKTLQLQKYSVCGGATERVAIEDAAGRISAGEIGVYPPGVPFVKKGDVIDEKTVSLLKKYRNRLFGLASGRVAVIKY